MSKVVLEGDIEVLPDELDRIFAELPVHIELTRKEEGCLVFTVTQYENNELRFKVYEEFINKRAFELHQERVKTSTWGLVTKNVKRFYTITN